MQREVGIWIEGMRLTIEDIRSSIQAQGRPIGLPETRPNIQVDKIMCPSL